MSKGYILPAIVLRKGFGKIIDKSMQAAFPGTGVHAVPRDLAQFLEQSLLRGFAKQQVITSPATIYGSGTAGE